LPPLLDSDPTQALRLSFFSGDPLPNAGWMAIFIPLLQSVIGRYEAAPFGATIGPLFLALLPGVLAKRKREPGSDPFPLGLAVLSAGAFWAVSGIGILVSAIYAQPRLFMVLFPAMALLAAYGFEGFWECRIGRVRAGAIASALVALTLLLSLAGGAVDSVRAGVPNYLAGVTDRTAYLEHNLGWHARAMDSLRGLPAGSRVLLLWEPRGLYCGGVCLEDSNIDRWYTAMRAGLSAPEIVSDWREAGFTHVLLFRTGADFERRFRPGYLPSDWDALAVLESELPPEAEFGGAYTLFRLPGAE
jgi:hypothetical protein